MKKDERALLTKDKLVVMSNLQEEADMLKWAGIDFGDEEIYKLNKSMKVSFQHLNIIETGSAIRCIETTFLGQDIWN